MTSHTATHALTRVSGAKTTDSVPSTGGAGTNFGVVWNTADN